MTEPSSKSSNSKKVSWWIKLSAITAFIVAGTALVGALTEVFDGTSTTTAHTTTAPTTTAPTTTAPTTTAPTTTPDVIVPDVSGLVLSDAQTRLEQVALEVDDDVVMLASETTTTGLVIGTRPSAGRSVDPGSPVRLIVSIGPPGLNTYVSTLAELASVSHAKPTVSDVDNELDILLEAGTYEITDGHTDRLDANATRADNRFNDLKAIETPPEQVAQGHQYLVGGDTTNQHWWQQLGQALYTRGDLKLDGLLTDGPSVELAASSRDIAQAVRIERGASFKEQHRARRRFALIGFVTASKSIDTVLDRICVSHAALHGRCDQAPQGVEGLQQTLVAELVDDIRALLMEGTSLNNDFEALLRQVDADELTASEFQRAYNEILNEAIWDVFAVRVYALQVWLSSFELDIEAWEDVKGRVTDMSSAAIQMATSLRGLSGTGNDRRQATETFKKCADDLLVDLEMLLSG